MKVSYLWNLVHLLNGEMYVEGHQWDVIGTSEWGLGVGPWSGTSEWDLGVGSWSGSSEWVVGVGHQSGTSERDLRVGLLSGTSFVVGLPSESDFGMGPWSETSSSEWDLVWDHVV